MTPTAATETTGLTVRTTRCMILQVSAATCVA